MLKYSVIVPVYNAESTIKRCLNSLVAENYQNAEIIIINDGSTDTSGEICKSFAAAYDTVRYYEKGNGGVSSARNLGIQYAKGVYILFVDSDDYVIDGFFDKLDSIVNDPTVDLYQFSYKIENESQVIERIRHNQNLRERENALPFIVYSICRKRLNSPWGKAYKRDIIISNGVHFPEGVSNSEDRVFNIHYTFYIQNFVVSDQVTNIINVTNEYSLSRRKQDDLQRQFKIADDYINNALRNSSISDDEKRKYIEAINYSNCISIYREAKTLRKEKVNWLNRQIHLWNKCSQINKNKCHYPKNWYCFVTSTPVKLRLTFVIDLLAKKLNG